VVVSGLLRDVARRWTLSFNSTELALCLRVSHVGTVIARQSKAAHWLHMQRLDLDHREGSGLAAPVPR